MSDVLTSSVEQSALFVVLLKPKQTPKCQVKNQNKSQAIFITQHKASPYLQNRKNKNKIGQSQIEWIHSV